MIWTMVHPDATLDHIGLLPSFLSLSDPRSAAEQFGERYIGGWHPQAGYYLSDGKLCFEDDDEPLPLLARTVLRKEMIYVYEYGLVAIVQPDGGLEVCRLD